MMDWSKDGKMRAENYVLDRVFYSFESSFQML